MSETVRSARVPQPMSPRGLGGRVLAFLMERMNAAACRRALDIIAPRPRGAFLEIGFGTGRLLAMAAREMGGGLVAGAEASPLMLAMASRRLHRLGANADLRLAAGPKLPWPDAQFDAVAALHSFQFWAAPKEEVVEAARVLRPGGLLVLILRARPRGRDLDWLPNPLSRTDSEPEQTLELLADTGFASQSRGRVGSSAVLVAVKPR